MIRLLIVDDESATRNGLLRYMDWKGLGVDMIQTAESGQEALAMCEDFQPDLVLSDIRMRGMNGVEMCTILHEKYPECRIIFISGYSDKEYLKAAIELGAVNYVEKPVDTEELKRAVQKAMASILETRRHRNEGERLSKSEAYLRREAFFSLLRGREPGESSEQNLEESGLFREGYPLMRICILRLSPAVTNLSRFRSALWETAGIRAFTERDCSVYGEFWDNRRLILLLCGTEEAVGNGSCLLKAISRAATGLVDGVRLFFALGEPVRNPHGLSHSYQSAHEAEKTVFYLGYGKSAERGRKDRPLDLGADYPAEFRQALSMGNEEAASQVLDRLAASLREGEAVASAFVQGLYFSLERELEEESLRLFPYDRSDMAKRQETDAQHLEGLDTIDDLNAFLRAQVHEIFALNSRDDSNSSVVLRVIRLIQQEYGDKDLSVKQLAENVYLTPTYLSGLFKRKTGKTIWEYLTSVRIERAKELLRNPRFKLYHISKQVGYEDANYFAKIFKKQTGVTPSEYREKNLL